ncbi:hypothetical protein [Psychroserpens algicola]|uniref:Uncharacterized protein n=1 Tax=Psychroserpens algicola TaxID=1719034 RepID=A0ABT0H3V4_9FLAO|nr:hypothetical protein [Psychroserpens algicola]MCK8479061.1 hypothetical protein [Psychroserpens algicola]
MTDKDKDEFEYRNHRGRKSPRRNKITPNLGRKKSKEINELSDKASEDVKEEE